METCERPRYVELAAKATEIIYHRGIHVPHPQADLIAFRKGKMDIFQVSNANTLELTVKYHKVDVLNFSLAILTQTENAVLTFYEPNQPYSVPEDWQQSIDNLHVQLPRDHILESPRLTFPIQETFFYMMLARNARHQGQDLLGPKAAKNLVGESFFIDLF